MANNMRVFYAIQSFAVGTQGATTFGDAQTVRGLQSLGINTRFNLEQVFEIGQISIYQQVEGLPAIEVTAEKCLDGKPLIYHLATLNAPAGTLNGRANVRSSLGLSIFSDQQDSASGAPVAECYCSGTYVSTLNYQFPVEGPARESITFVGNNKLWVNVASGATYSGVFNTNNESPANYPPIGVSARQHVVFGNTAQPGGTGQFMVNPCVLPIDIDGIDPATGYNLLQSNGNYGAHIQSIRVSANLGRDELHELGRKGPYHRYVNFPVEVRTDIEVNTARGDLVSGTEAGILGYGNNLTTRPIFISTLEGTKINLGSKNFLQSVTYGGGSAGTRGGIARVTYSYITFNDFIVQHPADPTVALAG